LKRGILTWLLLTLLAFWVDQPIIPSVFSTNSIIRVPEDYPTIQEAVDAAKPPLNVMQALFQTHSAIHLSTDLL